MRYSWTGRDLNAKPDDVIDDDVETITQKDIETQFKAQVDKDDDSNWYGGGASD